MLSGTRGRKRGYQNNEAKDRKGYSAAQEFNAEYHQKFIEMTQSDPDAIAMICSMAINGVLSNFFSEYPDPDFYCKQRVDAIIKRKKGAKNEKQK